MISTTTTTTMMRSPGADPQSSCRLVCLVLSLSLSLYWSLLFSVFYSACVLLSRELQLVPCSYAPGRLQTSSCIVYCVRRELAFSQIVDDVRRQSLHQSWPVVQHLLLLPALLCDSPSPSLSLSFIFGCVVCLVCLEEAKKGNGRITFRELACQARLKTNRRISHCMCVYVCVQC